MRPQSLNVIGATQTDLYQSTVDDMVQLLRIDPDAFWSDSFRTDGPVEVWELNGQRFLSNGNHRYQAASIADVEIPDQMIVIRQMTGSGVLTFRFDQMIWLPGRK